MEKPTPRLKETETAIREGLEHLGVPYIKVFASDNLMSCVNVIGSFDPKETWENGIRENGRYFHLMVMPTKERYYDPAVDARLKVELLSSGLKRRFRKYTNMPDLVVKRIIKWVHEARECCNIPG